MFDVGNRDLPVLTSGNCVIKGWVISGLWNYTYVFNVFFQNPKKHDFLRFFELMHTFSRRLLVTWWRRFSWPGGESGEIKLDALPLERKQSFLKRLQQQRRCQSHDRWPLAMTSTKTHSLTLRTFMFMQSHNVPRWTSLISLNRNENINILLSEIESYVRALLTQHSICLPLFFFDVCLRRVP